MPATKYKYCSNGRYTYSWILATHSNRTWHKCMLHRAWCKSVLHRAWHKSVLHRACYKSVLHNHCLCLHQDSHSPVLWRPRQKTPPVCPQTRPAFTQAGFDGPMKGPAPRSAITNTSTPLCTKAPTAEIHLHLSNYSPMATWPGLPRAAVAPWPCLQPAPRHHTQEGQHTAAGRPKLFVSSSSSSSRQGAGEC